MTELGDILVLGLGDSGDAVARYCARRMGSLCTSVTVLDASDDERLEARARPLRALGATVITGAEAPSRRYDLCVASPGIPPTATLMLAAREACAKVISEIEFAYRRSACPWVAITGTNGKTTTTSLVAHLLNDAGVSARAVGNIGVPAIHAVNEEVANEVLVAEVSSFQLALTTTFRPRVAVLLNVTPDHLDWHGSLEAYVRDKARIFANLAEGDTAVVDVDDAGSAPFAASLAERGVRVVTVTTGEPRPSGAGVRDGRLVLSTGHGEVPLCRIDELRIKGPHNVSNALAAAAAAVALGVHASGVAQALATFMPIEHRLEPAGSACGFEWVNDSKATNPDAVMKAVTAFAGHGFVVLLGGRNKGNSFEPLAREIARAGGKVVAFGEAADEIVSAFPDGVPLRRVSALADAVRAAIGLAEPGDAIVLSPACASFDQFNSYEERGRTFKHLVSALECSESGL